VASGRSMPSDFNHPLYTAMGIFHLFVTACQSDTGKFDEKHLGKHFIFFSMQR
jgi:hypothetical protein